MSPRARFVVLKLAVDVAARRTGPRRGRSEPCGGTRSRAGSTRPAYLAERDGAWVEVSWAEAARRVDDIAAGLLALGVKKGDAFAILGSTSLEWCLFDFALGLIGAIGAPVYSNSSPKDCAYVIDHSESVGVLVEDAGAAREGRGGARRSCHGPPPRAHLRRPAGPRGRGRAYAAEHPGTLDEAAAQVGEEDLFTYIYTSGTTGPPKGCMIRHRNYYEMVAVVDRDAGRFVEPDDTLLLYLPLAHNYGRLIHLQAPFIGYTLALCRDPLRVADALLAVRPTVFPSVPRVYEKIHTAVLAKLDEAHGPRRALGRLGNRGRARGEPPPPGRQAAAAVAGAPSPHRRPARLLQGEGTARRPAAHRELGRRPSRPRDHGVLPHVRHPRPRGLRPDRVHDRLLGRTARTSFRFGTVGQAAPRLRGQAGRRRRAPDPQRDRVRRLLQGRGGDPRRRSTRTAGCAPATSPRSTRTGSSRSPTARRTSSSPPAARTSPRRTSRTS